MKLMPHQSSAVEFLLDRPAMMLAFDLGTGKSAIAVKVVEHEKLINRRKAVVICPSYLTRNWAAEFRKFSDCLTTDIQKDGKYEANKNADVIIASYGMLEAVEHHIKERRVVVYDEAHYLCGRNSNRSKLAQELCRAKLHRLLLLTGTPMRNRIPDLYALFKMMDRVWSHGFLSKFHGYTAFCETFCHIDSTPIPGKHFNRIVYYGHKNMDYLHPWLNVFWMRCRINDVVDLPPLSHEEIEIDGVSEAIERKLEVAWKQHDTGIVAQKHAFGQDVGEHISKAKSMSALAKAPMTAEYVLDLLRNEGGPILVFSDHREPCEKLYTILKTSRKQEEKATYRVEMIRGDTSAATRHNVVDRYQRGEIDVICATIGALQTGVTLTRGNICLFNDLSWDPSSNAQAAGRIYRIGQSRPCFVYTCVGGPIDAKIVKMLRAKERTIKEVMK